MHAGESRDLTIKLPDEFEPAALRGVDVACTVAVSELFSYDLPEVSHCWRPKRLYINMSNKKSIQMLMRLDAVLCRCCAVHVGSGYRLSAGICKKHTACTLETLYRNHLNLVLPKHFNLDCSICCKHYLRLACHCHPAQLA